MEPVKKVNFFEYSLSESEDFFEEKDEKRFRARQLFQWVYEKGVIDPEKMLNLSKDFRQRINQLFQFNLPRLLKLRISEDGTRKYLFGVSGGGEVEAVMIPAKDRTTLCLSSEVGCNMACTFCFTGKQKLKKRLTAGEIVGQFLQVQKDIDRRITNIVFMGMGEPLDNISGIFKAIEIFKSDIGLNISRKKITVSTSGLVPQIKKVSELGVHLAVSLNAPNDLIRNQIMPVNRKYPLRALIRECIIHTEKAKDRITFEYVLLKDVNDQVHHAGQMAELVKKVPCKINLIPFNEHPDSGYQRPSRNQVFLFQKHLLNCGIHVTIRRTMGRDIFAACGQLVTSLKEKADWQNVLTGVVG